MFRLYVRKLKENHRVKQQLKENVRIYRKYTSYFLKISEASQFKFHNLEKTT